MHFECRIYPDSPLPLNSCHTQIEFYKIYFLINKILKINLPFLSISKVFRFVFKEIVLILD